jgi:hypothetical protein
MKKLWLLCLLCKTRNPPDPNGLLLSSLRMLGLLLVLLKMLLLLLRFFFSQSGKLLKAANAIIITLVSKRVNPSKMGDFRPILSISALLKFGESVGFLFGRLN